MNIKESANLWVNRDMIAVPLTVVEKLCKYSDYCDMNEITPISINDRIYYIPNDEYGYITGCTTDDEGNIYIINLDSGEQINVTDECDLEILHDDYFPMWGTLWAFDNSFDSDWLENNLQIMANLGFRIYESEDYGYVFGIDGAGYDFYESHWIPLYKARGLKWHETE